MTLNVASEEQQYVIDQVLNNNVIVNATAGSGKTTTILHIAQKYIDLNILILTYNVKLRLETKERIDTLKLNNTQIFTYHGFCSSHYSFCPTDAEMIKICEIPYKIETPKIKFSYDLVIIDESQDMTFVYYQFVCKLIKDNDKIPKFCILGDHKQSIFGFNGSNPYFINFAHQIFNFNDLMWLSCNLNTSYRLTLQMEKFINDCVLHENNLKTQKHGPKVEYHICNVFDDTVYNLVIKILETHGPDDIFILAPSIRKKEFSKNNDIPIQVLANKLTSNNHLIYVPDNDTSTIDHDVIKGKIAFSTFHQAKGLERNVVIVFGLDSNYYKYYNKTSDPNICSNEIYVALTRAKEKLILIHPESNDFLKFFDVKKMMDYSEFITIFGMEKLQVKYSIEQINNGLSQLGVTDFLKHLPSQILVKAKEYFKITLIQNKSSVINIDVKTKQKDYYEAISDITGIAIPAYFEYINTNKMSIHKKILESNKFPKLPIQLVKKPKIKYLLQIATAYQAIRSGYNFKIDQIIDYNWLSKNQLNSCLRRLNKQILPNSKFEEIIKYSDNGIGGILTQKNIMLCGEVDCISGNNVWELKCTSQFSDTHFVQLALYAFMIEHQLKCEIDPEIEQIIKKYNISNYIYSVDEQVTFKIDNNIMIGKITAIFKNNNINIKVGNAIYKVPRNSIVKINKIDDEIKNIGNNYVMRYEYKLFNILTDEIYKIEATYNNLLDMATFLFTEKYNNKISKNNIEFINQIDAIKKIYF